MSSEVLQVRIDEHARRITDLERTQPAVLATEVKELREDVRELRDDVKANKRAQWALAASIVTGSLTLAFVAFQIAGGS